MQTECTEEQKLLRDGVSRFVERRYAFESRNRLVDGAAGFSEDNWRLFAEMGWLAVGLPEAFGGLGGSMANVMVVAEELGKGLVTEPSCPAACWARVRWPGWRRRAEGGADPWPRRTPAPLGAGPHRARRAGTVDDRGATHGRRLCAGRVQERRRRRAGGPWPAGQRRRAATGGLRRGVLTRQARVLSLPRLHPVDECARAAGRGEA